MSQQPRLQFWYEFGSTYSYPAAFAVRRLKLPALWQPFLLGPIFTEQGWNTSPFVIYPAKGRYMWRDVARLCDKAELPFVQPSKFPRNGLLAARVAMSLQGNVLHDFSLRVLAANFAEDREISEPAVLIEIMEDLGLQPSELLETAGSQQVKDMLRQRTTQASERGIFGAPTFVVGDELFWGGDRLSDAVEWASVLGQR